MTPEMRADCTASGIDNTIRKGTYDSVEVSRFIENEIRAAVAEEREACASLADLNSKTDETASSACHTIAAAIRARSTT